MIFILTLALCTLIILVIVWVKAMQEDQKKMLKIVDRILDIVEVQEKNCLERKTRGNKK